MTASTRRNQLQGTDNIGLNQLAAWQSPAQWASPLCTPTLSPIPSIPAAACPTGSTWFELLPLMPPPLMPGGPSAFPHTLSSSSSSFVSHLSSPACPILRSATSLGNVNADSLAQQPPPLLSPVSTSAYTVDAPALFDMAWLSLPSPPSFVQLPLQAGQLQLQPHQQLHLQMLPSSLLPFDSAQLHNSTPLPALPHALQADLNHLPAPTSCFDQTALFDLSSAPAHHLASDDGHEYSLDSFEFAGSPGLSPAISALPSSPSSPASASSPLSKQLADPSSIPPAASPYQSASSASASASASSPTLVSSPATSVDDMATSGSTQASTQGVSKKRKKPRRVTSFQCTLCPKVYTRKHNLEAHIHSHSNIRPHLCQHDGCTKAFTRKNDLCRHITTVHERRVIASCSSCGVDFFRGDAFYRHLRTMDDNGGCCGTDQAADA